MLRVFTASNRALAQRVARTTLTFTRAASNTDPESGSVSSSGDAFSKKEKAEETRWARRHDAEQMDKYRASQPGKSAQGAGQQPSSAQGSGGQKQAGAQNYGRQQSGGQGGAGGSNQQRLASLEAEKRRIENEIEQLKRQKP